MSGKLPDHYATAHKLIDSITPLCKKQDSLFKRLSKLETGWLLDALMIYVRLDIKASDLIDLDDNIIHSLQMEIEDLKLQNTKLTDQIQEMRHYD